MSKLYTDTLKLIYENMQPRNIQSVSILCTYTGGPFTGEQTDIYDHENAEITGELNQEYGDVDIRIKTEDTVIYMPVPLNSISPDGNVTIKADFIWDEARGGYKEIA